ncbi:hypothetical protein PV392_27560 [Streptomyces sp. ME03-5709C]|nr:hypothetical protein [Streptomyces sp. ME03-5709C]
MTQATYVRTATVPLGELRPFPGNAKRGDVPTILESLCRNGQYRSLVVREVEPGHLVTLAGNHTAQALAAHGSGDCGMTVKVDGQERLCAVCGNQPWDPVARCEIVTCDEQTATRINLVDNRSSDVGEMDESALAELIAGLDGDLGGTGYDPAELNELLAAIEQAEEDDPEPYEPPTPATPAQDGTAPAAATPAPAPASSGEQHPAAPAAGDQAPAPTGEEQATMLLAFTTADRKEAARLVTVAREVFADDTTAVIVLRALRALVAVLDSRHAHDGAVTLAALLKAAGADAA